MTINGPISANSWPHQKIVLGGLLTVIYAAGDYLIPGGLGPGVISAGPGQGVIANVAGEPVTLKCSAARQMLRQRFPAGERASMLLPYFAERRPELISRQAILAEAARRTARHR